MDIQMHCMNGNEANRKTREINNELVIIAQTDYALSGDREKTLTAGSDDYSSKPVNREVLMKKSSALL